MSRNCSLEFLDHRMYVVQLAVHIPTFLLGLFLNMLAIHRFRPFLRQRCAGRTATSICIINLAVFNLLLVLSLPFRMALSWDEHSPGLCTLTECLYFISMYGSVFTICFISLDRFLVVRFPLSAKYLRTPRNTLCICAIIWVMVWVGSIPIYNFHDRNATDVTCFRKMSNSTWSPSVIVPLEVFGFLLPLSIVGFCSFRTIHILLSRRGHPQDWDQQKACIWVIAANLAVFVLSFLPVHLAIFLQFLVRNGFIEHCETKRNISTFVQGSMCLSNTNCCLDVFCYYFVIKEFRARRPSGDHTTLQDTIPVSL